MTVLVLSGSSFCPVNQKVVFPRTFAQSTGLHAFLLSAEGRGQSWAGVEASRWHTLSPSTQSNNCKGRKIATGHEQDLYTSEKVSRST